MKKSIHLTLLGILVLVIGLRFAWAALVVDSAAVNPSSTPVGIASVVTVTAVITEPSVLPEGVNLQRLDSAGRVIAVLGILRDDGLSGDATANDKTFTLRTTVFETTPGPVRLRVSAAFRGSLLRAFSSPLTVNVTGTSTGIAILSPANLAYVNTTPVNVAGTVGDPGAQVTVNGINAAVNGGNFLLTVPLVEGNNTLTAVAQNTGGSTSTASIQLTLDTTPPRVTVEAPANNLVTTDSAITVSGTVNDIVVGTVNDQQATVTVNGIPAQVANRSFVVANVPLALGQNTVQAIGRDRSGNSATANIQVRREAPTQPFIRIISGNNQSAPVSSLVAAPLVIALDNGQGGPVANANVVFNVTDNNGIINAGGPGSPSLAVVTNSAGQAQVSLRLGSRAGAGSNRVDATATGFGGTAVFTATGTPTGAKIITLDAGNNQSGALGEKLAFPFVTVVTDAGFNRIGGVPVTFTVKQGGGTINGLPNATMTTDSDGRALAVLTLGTQAGQDNNLVEASFPGNPGLPAAFVASAKAPGNAADTRITGAVLDNSNNPIEGVTLRLFLPYQGNNNNTPIQVGSPVQTNAQGQFLIQPAPIGYFKLMADGSTVSPLKGAFPTLEYDLVTVAGQNNTVGMPIYLPILDTVNKLCVTETTGGTLTLPQVPGFALTVAAGSATFPGGSRSGCVTVSSVNGDKVPMSPGFGQQPRFIVTIQPVGTLFNPPAPITMPNVDGLGPGQVTELYSYDHDLSAFTAIGTGTVSADGLLIRSDPGVGILKAGWHCGGDPAANGTVADCPECQWCQGNSCVTDPAQANKLCDSGKGCCKNGSCSPLGPPVPGTNSTAPLTHTLGGVANPGANFGLTVVTIGQQGVTGPTFNVTAYIEGANWVFRVDSITHSYKVGVNSQGKIDIANGTDSDITPATKAAIIADLTPPAPGAGTGPPRSTYWSQSITQAHEQCHVDRFYTDANFWPKFMKMFEDAVEAEKIPVKCDDPAANSAAAVIASRQAAWQTLINGFHSQADTAEIGGSEVACHNVSNPMYTTLINSIP